MDHSIVCLGAPLVFWSYFEKSLWMLACAVQSGKMLLNARSHWKTFKQLTLSQQAEKISELLVTFVVPSKIFKKSPHIQQLTCTAHEYATRELGIAFKEIQSGTPIPSPNSRQQLFDHLKHAERQAGKKLTVKEVMHEMGQFKQSQAEKIVSGETKAGLGETQGRVGVNLAHEGSAAKATKGIENTKSDK